MNTPHQRVTRSGGGAETARFQQKARELIFTDVTNQKFEGGIQSPELSIAGGPPTGEQVFGWVGKFNSGDGRIAFVNERGEYYVVKDTDANRNILAAYRYTLDPLHGPPMLPSEKA